MTPRCLLAGLLALVTCAVAPVQAVDVKDRSVSSSRQFIIFCPDVGARGRVAGFAEEVKASLLTLLGEGDRWKAPVLITLERAETLAPGTPAVRLQPIETPQGTRIQIDVALGDDPAAVNLPKQIVRALLLEIAYRDRGGIKGGQPYVEPPWWLIEGALQNFRQREEGIDVALFQGIVATDKIPPIADFLSLHETPLGATAQAVDAAYAMCLVELLIGQPNGRANLARLLRNWPDRSDDPVSALTKDFPALGAGGETLQKWWTLNVAHFSAADRYKGMSVEQTDSELSELLEFELVINKAGDKKRFTLSEFEKFVKLPSSKAAMQNIQGSLVRLSTRANALFRPVIVDYEKIFAQLARKKTRGITERLAEIQRYRDVVLHRMAAIGDYLNWFEATQFGARSHAFDSYMKVANEAAAEELRVRANDPIGQYLDGLEQEF